MSCPFLWFWGGGGVITLLGLFHSLFANAQTPPGDSLALIHFCSAWPLRVFLNHNVMVPKVIGPIA